MFVYKMDSLFELVYGGQNFLFTFGCYHSAGEQVLAKA